MKIKKGDNVMIIAGKDKKKTGKVERVIPEANKLIVSGLNMNKVHVRPRKSGQKGQIIQKSMPIHISNVMIVDPKDNKPTRIGAKMVGDKKKRMSKRSKDILD